MKVRNRNATGNRSRRGNHVTGLPLHAHGQVNLPPPALKAGQERCDVCRNGAHITVNGYLRHHNDLFGHRCYNKARSA